MKPDLAVPLFKAAYWRLLCVTLSLLVFASDALTPPDYAHGTLYLLVLPLAMLTRDNRFVVLMTGLSLIFVVVGALLGPAPRLGLLLANRGTVALGLLCLSWTCLLVNRQMAATQPQNSMNGLLFDTLDRLLLHSRRAGDGAGAGPLPAGSTSDFRQFADQLPHIVWVATDGGEVFFGNKALGSYAGLTPAQLYPRPGWGSTVSPLDLPATEAAWREALRTGTPLAVAARLRRHDGVYRWHQVLAHPLRDDSGRLLAWYGSAVDVEDALVRTAATA